MRKTLALMLILFAASLPLMGNIRLSPGGSIWLSDGGVLLVAPDVIVPTPTPEPVDGDVTATMTSYTAPPPNIVTSYQNYVGAFAGWSAFDGVAGTRWQGSTAAPGPHITYDWGTGTKKIIKKIRLLNQNTTTDVKQFFFQGSDNGTDFTTVAIATAAKSASWQTFTTGNTTEYQMYRFYPQSIYGGVAPALLELEYWEVE